MELLKSSKNKKHSFTQCPCLCEKAFQFGFSSLALKFELKSQSKNVILSFNYSLRPCDLLCVGYASMVEKAQGCFTSKQ